MIFRNWAEWFRSRSRTRASRQRPYFRPELEGLEHRVVPAFNTTISTSSTINVIVGGAAGAITFTANGSGANVNVTDILQQLQSALTTEVQVLTGTGAPPENGDITWLAGANLDFASIGGQKTLRLQPDASSLAGNITVNSAILDSAPGAERLSINFNAIGAVVANGSINTNGGTATFSAGGPITLGAVLSAGGVAATSGGNLTVAASVMVAGGNVNLSATNAISDIAVNAQVVSDTGNINLLAGRNLTMNAGNITTSANVTLTAQNGSISEAGTGSITAALLTASSLTGATLTAVSNTVASFNAANANSGNINLLDGVALNITGVNQTGVGNLIVNNTGPITVSGNVSSAGNVSLTSTAALNETGTGRISAVMLSTSTAGGTLLTGSNAVASFNAVNGLSGDVALVNTASPLTITGIGQAGGGNLSVNNTGGLATSGGITTGPNGNISLTASGPLSVGAIISAGGSGTVTLATTGLSGDVTLGATVRSTSGNIAVNTSRNITLNAGNVSTSGNVSLAASSGTIAEAGAGTIAASLLTTSSVGGTALNTANVVSSFNATNASNGDIRLTNTAAPLTITGITQSGGGAVGITNTGGIVVAGASSVGGAGSVSLTAMGATSDVTFNATLTSVSGDINVNAGRSIIFNAGSLQTAGNVTLTAQAGSIAETGAGQISAFKLILNAFAGVTLNAANVVFTLEVVNFSTGDVSFTNNQQIGLDLIDQKSAGNVTINANGSITVSGLVTAAGIVTLSAVGNILENGPGTIGAGRLNISSAGGATLNNANTVGNFSAANSSSGAISLANTASPLTILGIQNSALGGAVSVNNTGPIVTTAPVTTAGNGNVSLSATGTVIIGAAVTAAGNGTVNIAAGGAGSDIVFNATLSSTSGNLTATASRFIVLNAGSLTTAANVTLIAATGTIAQNGTGIISASQLSTSSAGGTKLTNANTLTGFSANNTTGGDISLTNTAPTLTITGVAQTGGGNIAVSNTGGLNTTGAVSTGANGTITLNATAPVTIGAAVTAGGSGGVNVMTAGPVSDINVNGSIGSSTGPVVVTAGRHITLNAGHISTGGNIALNASGTINEAGTGAISGAALAISSNGGASLGKSNNVASLSVSNTGGGNVVLTNTAAPLTVTGITFAGTGFVTIINSGGITVTGTITGPNSLTFASTAAQNIGANINIPGTVTLSPASGGVDQFGGTIAATTLALSGSGNFKLNQANSLAVLQANVSGGINLRVVGNLTLDGLTTQGNPLALTIGGSLTNNQAINVGASTFAATVGSNATFNNNAAITASATTATGNNTTGTLTLNYTVASTWTLTGPNQGTITNSAIPTGITYSGMANVFAANATFLPQPGSSVTGNLVVTQGTLKLVTPDGKPFVLVVGGDVTLGVNTTVEFDILGTQPGPNGYSKLVTGGAATLNGAKLDVELKNGFVPPDMAFVLVKTDGPVNGLFTNLQGQPLPDGAEFTTGGQQFVIHYSTMPGQPGDPVCLYPSSQVNDYNSQTQLGSNINPVILGQTAQLTAVLSIPALSLCPPNFGVMTLREGSTAVGTSKISADGTAAFQMTFTTLGAHTFTAIFANDNPNMTIQGSTSAPIVVTVNPTPKPGQNVFVTGADAGGGPDVKVFNAVTHELVFGFFAYNPLFTGGVRVAVGDVDGDGFSDVVTAAGPGGGPDVAVFSGKDTTRLFNFFAFNPLFTGGVYVAAGDVNGDGFADIIVGADSGGGPNVSVFSGKDQARTRLTSFFAYDPSFTGGVRVAAADVNGDGFADPICGAGVGGGPNVTVFSGKDNAQTRLLSFFAYDPLFTVGIYVAGGDVNGDGKADIMTGPGAGGGPTVAVFNGADGSFLSSFFAYESNFFGGVRVGAAVQANFIAHLVTVEGPQTNPAAGPVSSPLVKIFNPLSGALLDSFFAVDPRFTGGLYVAGNT